jgi:hypothetical protein
MNQLRVKNSYAFTQEPAVLASKIDQARRASDKKIRVYFDTLARKLKLPAQANALKTYQNAVTTALKARRTTQDIARAAYFKSFNDIVTAHRTTTDSQLTTLQSQFQSAVTRASSICQKSGIDIARTQLVGDVSLSEGIFIRNPNIASASIQTALDGASAAYQNTNATTDASFAQALQSARAELKTALGPNPKNIF